jgi:hypothetical protein
MTLDPPTAAQRGACAHRDEGGGTDDPYSATGAARMHEVILARTVVKKARQVEAMIGSSRGLAGAERGVALPAAPDQTGHMVDLGAPDRVLAELADERRQFEKGAAAPIGVRDRLVELADALTDSGPLELGVSPRRWVRAERRFSDLVGDAQQNPTGPLSATRAKEAIGVFRRLMRLSAWSSRWRARTRGSRWATSALFAFCAVGLAGLTWLIESLAHGQSSARWLLPGLLIVTIFFFASMSSIWRATEAARARELAAKAAPTERHLAYCRMPGRRFLIATDQRVLAINLPSVRNSSRALWSMPYSQISSFERGPKRNDRWVTLHAGGMVEQIEVRILGDDNQGYDYQKYHQEALLAILSRRTRSAPAIALDRG